MRTALELIACIALIALSVSIVLIAVEVRRTSSTAFLTLDRAHERWVKHVEGLQDRLLAHNWEEYVTIRTEGGEDEGGFFTPDDQRAESDDGEAHYGEVEQLIPTRWGSLTPISNIPRPGAEEEKLLAEDFGDDDEPRRGDAV